MGEVSFVIRRKVKTIGSEYWTGRAWSIYQRFAKPYSLSDGIGVLRKRFRSQAPLPMLVAERDLNG